MNRGCVRKRWNEPKIETCTDDSHHQPAERNSKEECLTIFSQEHRKNLTDISSLEVSMSRLSWNAFATAAAELS